MSRIFLAFAVCTLFTFSMASNATIIYAGSGLSGTFVAEDFDTNAGEGSAAAEQFSGISFGASNYVTNNYSGTYPNMTNSVIANFENNTCGPCYDPTSFSFAGNLTELAFAFISNEQTTTFSAFLDGILIESVALLTNFSGNYVTVSGYLFDEIRITSVGSNDAYLIDDMQYKSAQVPEPASWALLGIAIAGFGLFRRNKAA